MLNCVVCDVELMNEDVSGRDRYLVPFGNVNCSGLSEGVSFPEVSITCPECGKVNTWELNMDKVRKQVIIGATRV